MDVFLSTLSLALGVYAVIIFAVLGLRKAHIIDDTIPNLVLFKNHQQVVIAMFVVALVAFLGSNYYSEIVGYTPCKLCWYQRILFFPQLFLLGLALWKKQWSIVPYIALLSVIGLCIAGYHYYGQMGGVSSLPCDASGSCTFMPFGTFGFVTIPLMAFFGFLGQLALYAQYRTLSRRGQ